MAIQAQLWDIAELLIDRMSQADIEAVFEGETALHYLMQPTEHRTPRPTCYPRQYPIPELLSFEWNMRERVKEKLIPKMSKETLDKILPGNERNAEQADAPTSRADGATAGAGAERSS